MWSIYDHGGQTLFSQDSIAAFLPALESVGGTAANRIANGVRAFTYAYDASFDEVSSADQNAVSEFVAREITSIEDRDPVIAVVEGELHSVLLVGGTWSNRTDGYRQWDYVYFHDPNLSQYYPGSASYINRSAGQWIQLMCPGGYSVCGQVINNAAVTNYWNNLVVYGSEVKVRGYRSWPREDWPPAY